MNEQDIKEFQKNFTHFDKIKNADKILQIQPIAQEYNYALTNGTLISKYIFLDNTEIAYKFISIIAKDITKVFPDLYIFKIDLEDVVNNNKIELLDKFKQFLVYAHFIYLHNIKILETNKEIYSLVSHIVYNLHETSHLLVSANCGIDELQLDNQFINTLKNGRIISIPHENESEENFSLKDFAQFIKEVKKEAGVEEQLDSFEKRDEFIEKLYIWEMKNFNVQPLKDIINDDDIDKIKNVFHEFTDRIKELMELHKEYGLLNTHYFKNEAKEIENLLFDPMSISTIKEKIEILKDKIKYLRSFRDNVKINMYFENFISDSTNRSAYNKITEIINEENTDNIVIITGSNGTGKTHLLNAIINTMSQKRIVLIDKSSLDIAKNNDYIFKYIDMLDMILIDNLDDIYKYAKDMFYKILKHNAPKIITMHRKYSIETKEVLEYLNNYPTFNIQPSSLFIRKSILKNMLAKHGISINEIMLNYLLDYIELPLSKIEKYIIKLREISGNGIPDINQIHTIFPRKEKKKNIYKKSQFDTSKMIKSWSNEHDRLYVEFED